MKASRYLIGEPYASAAGEGTPMSASAGRPHVIRSAARGLAILRCVYRSGQGRHLADISVETGIDKATALRSLSTLVAEGIILRDEATGAYRPDLSSWIYLAPSVQPGLVFVSAVRNRLDKLAETTGMTAGIVLPTGDRRTTAAVMWSLAKTWVHYDPANAPLTVPLHASASGKCLLASFSPTDLRGYLSVPLERLTDRTITSAGQLVAELERVRELGYATHAGELTPGVCSVAVPLLVGNGPTLGGVTVAFPRGEIGDLPASVLPTLRDAARDVSNLLSPEAWLDIVRENHGGGQPTPSPWDTPDPGFGEGPVRHVRSVSRMIRLMAAVFREPEGVSVRELARRRGLDKTITWRLLSTLVDGGVLSQDIPDQRYRVSPGFWLRQAGVMQTATSVTRMVSAVLEHVCKQTEATVLLTLPDKEMRNTTVYQYCLPRSALCFHPEHGPFAPLHTTAAGKVYLAARPPAEVRRYIEGGLPALTAHSVTSGKQLLDELDRVRSAGFAVSREETVNGLTACAVPVRDAAGTVVASLAVAWVLPAVKRGDEAHWVPTLQDAARALAPLLVRDWRDRLGGPLGQADGPA